MSHEEWKFRKGSLRKSSYFRNLEVGEISRRFTETGLGKRCELNVDQEHAPAIYRKALIEIIAQYLGAVVRCGNSIKLRQETPFRVMQRQQKNKRSGKYCEKCRIPPLLEML